MSRFLLEPCSNTLSHIAKCLALREELAQRGHEVVIAVSAARESFLKALGIGGYVVLPDIQESDAGSLPGFSWFRPERFAYCVRAEVDLLRSLRPDRVLGVFRFTGRLSAALAGVPYDSLICGAMTPFCRDVPGFAANEPGAAEQAAAMRFFRTTCATRLRPAFAALGLPAIDDIWELLIGRRTYLWDYPEFQPLPTLPDVHHVGPVLWSGWPRRDVSLEKLDALRGPLAFVTLGTGTVPQGWLAHLVRILWRMGHSVALALGGQTAIDGLPSDPQRLAVFDFLPSELALPRAELMVCHGGQGVIFEALHNRVPILVLPMQPEQAQNGVCLERLGCGRRMLRGMVFAPPMSDIGSAFLAAPVAEIAGQMQSFAQEAQLGERLEVAAQQLDRYHGTQALATWLETT